MKNIEQILKQEPNLTPFGIEESFTGVGFDADEINQIDTCINWLKSKKIDNKINRVSTSYGIKHIIERELKTYISNGSFIAAVLSLGIPYKRIKNSPNILIAISAKELRCLVPTV